jgi:hypothetical protein
MFMPAFDVCQLAAANAFLVQCHIVLQVGDKTLDIKHVGQDGILRGGCLPPPKGRLRIGATYPLTVRCDLPEQIENYPFLKEATAAQIVVATSRNSARITSKII